jgi:hypothetical protein
MKKVIVSIVAVAFALAVQAGETKKAAGSKDLPPCCSAKTTQTKATISTADKGKAACSGGACKDAPSKRVLLSPKAAAEVGR